MKRFQILNALFPFAFFGLVGMMTVPGCSCGGSGSTEKDSGEPTDGRKDVVGSAPDGGASEARIAQPEVGTNLPDGPSSTTDGAGSNDAVVANNDSGQDGTSGPSLDAPNSDDSNGGTTNDANAGPDILIQSDGVVATPIDGSTADRPVGVDLAGTGGSGGMSGTGGSGGIAGMDGGKDGSGGTIGAVDGAVDGAIDANNVDGTGIDVSASPDVALSPAVLTGWPTSTFDFGLNPCGGNAPAVQTFTLTNSGGSAAQITSAVFAGSAGYTSDAAGKTISAGGVLVVALHAPAIPQIAAVPASFDDTLTIQTDVPNDGQHLISVTEQSQGAVLAWNAVDSFGSFASLPPGETTSESFHVLNSGNLDAQVNLVATGAFSVTSTSPVTIAQSQLLAGVVAFTAPDAAGPAASTLSVTLATPVALCQPLPSPLVLTGSSLNGGIALSALSLSFSTPCGASATSQSFTVTNTGTTGMTWAAALEGGSGSIFQLSSSGATLAAPVDGSPEPASHVTVSTSSPSNATPVTDTIDITTNIIGDNVHHITLTQTPLGDVVSVAGPTTLNLGSVPIAAPAQQSTPVVLTVRNDANPSSAPAAVTFSVTGGGAQYFTVDPSSVNVPAGGQVNVAVTFSPGTDTNIITSGNQVDLSATIQWQVGSEANCGTASGSLSATGTATLALVAGIPASVDFGLVNCGATAGPQQITLTNPGTASYRMTAITLDNSSHYALSYPTLPATVTPSGGSAIITITPSAIPGTVASVPDHATYDGNLVITTDAINDTPHHVSLTMGAEGVIITNDLWPTEWNFGTANVGATRKLNVNIVNAGNASAQASLQNAIYAGDQVFSLVSSQTFGPAKTSNIVALFQPTDYDLTYTETASLVITPANGQVFCQPLPASWNSSTPNIHMQGMSASSP